MDRLSGITSFNTLSLLDLMQARDQFHAHFLHKANVIGTAVGLYLIRKSDPYPKGPDEEPRIKRKKEPRTLGNSEVRSYSWPCVLAFVREWVEEERFGGSGDLAATDMVPKTIYLQDGRSVPICVVLAPPVSTAPPPLDPQALVFPRDRLSGGYPVIARVQGETRIASLGCLLTDGHLIYALTSRHVAGRAGEKLYTRAGGKDVLLGASSEKQLGRASFERVYPGWPGEHVYVNMDVGLIEIEDQTHWRPSIFGLGAIGPLADISIHNLTLRLIGCPVRAFGVASGRLAGQIAAFFYRYQSVGGFELVADFLIGSRDSHSLRTLPGDSGTLWVVDGDDTGHEAQPIAVQWGGAVFAADAGRFPFALATNLSTVCRELEVDVFRGRELASFEYWGEVGHYTIGSYACPLVIDGKLQALMTANRSMIGFDSQGNITPNVIPLADVPDKVWKLKKTPATPYGRKGPENPNHYADIDYRPNGGQSLDDLTSNAAALEWTTWRDYYHSIGWNAVSQRGLLPFRVWQIYKRMVECVVAGNVAEFVAAAGVLAHYVGDACQPLHSSYLDDGDPFRNPDGSPASHMLDHGTGYGHGVHTAYEKDMIDAHVDDLFADLAQALGSNHQMLLVQGGRQAGFATMELMRRTRARVAPMDLVETYAGLWLAHHQSQAPTLLWQTYHQGTVAAIADGCCTLAMLWDSAWAEGGGAQLPSSQLQSIDPAVLKAIYENQNFVPSKPLGQINDFL